MKKIEAGLTLISSGTTCSSSLAAIQLRGRWSMPVVLGSDFHIVRARDHFTGSVVVEVPEDYIGIVQCLARNVVPSTK